MARVQSLDRNLASSCRLRLLPMGFKTLVPLATWGFWSAITRRIHDLHCDLHGRTRPVQELAGVATISPDQPDAMA